MEKNPISKIWENMFRVDDSSLPLSLIVTITNELGINQIYKSFYICLFAFKWKRILGKYLNLSIM